MKIKKVLLKRLPLLHVQSRLISMCFVTLTNHSSSQNLSGQTCETTALDYPSDSQSVVPGTNSISISREAERHANVQAPLQTYCTRKSQVGCSNLCFKEPSR